jgi:hypothetical protein
MKILIACEESQSVCKAFRKLGHEAYSCDIKDCTGGHPEWHIKGDALAEAYSGKYDMMIAHPPCTYLAVSGACWLYNKDKTINQDRLNKQEEALQFVRKLMDAPIERIIIENPVSVISTKIRKPDQIIHPWQFGHESSKTTCLWFKNVPKLIPTNIVGKGEFFYWIDKRTGKTKRQPLWFKEARSAKTPQERQTIRSKTFEGIANAMAEQWGNLFTPIQNNLF